MPVSLYEEVIRWVGSALLILACCCLALIQLRRSMWRFAENRRPFFSWDSVDTKLLKTSGLLLISGSVIFAAGFIF